MRSAFDHEDLRVYDVLCILKCLPTSTAYAGKGRLSTLVSMLIGFRKSTGREVREERAAYVTAGHEGTQVWFDHERLDVYRKALEIVAWRKNSVIGNQTPYSYTYSYTRISSDTGDARKRQ